MEPWLLFLFPLLISVGLVNGAPSRLEEKKVLHLLNFMWKQQSATTASCHFLGSKTEKGAILLEMKHTSHCLGQTITLGERLQGHLAFDEVRVRSLQSKMKNTNSGNPETLEKTQIPLSSGSKLRILNYIVSIQLGNRTMAVIVDTGSDLTWVQCQPCQLCYNQQDPLFDPSFSSSYQSLPCNSSACVSLQYATRNSGVCGQQPSICNYSVTYGDTSYSRGELGEDRLGLGTTPVDNFVFGCGRDNSGLFGGTAGIIGFGRSNLSLVSQTSFLFEGVFSYCLPSTEDGNSGSLALGSDVSVFKNSSPISYTTMISNPQLPTSYFLNLTGISIGGVFLQNLSFSKGGVLIDSGTVITRLPPSIYGSVKTQFLKQFSGFPSVPGYSILDTCFNLTGYEDVNLPTIRMHFNGEADLNVDVTGILYLVRSDASQACLALSSLSYEDEIGIIGNYQQKNIRVVYDIKGSTVGFAEEACSFV